MTVLLSESPGAGAPTSVRRSRFLCLWASTTQSPKGLWYNRQAGNSIHVITDHLVSYLIVSSHDYEMDRNRLNSNPDSQ